MKLRGMAASMAPPYSFTIGCSMRETATGSS
jgi:hypothetical protein